MSVHRCDGLKVGAIECQRTDTTRCHCGCKCWLCPECIGEPQIVIGKPQSAKGTPRKGKGKR